MRVNYILLVEKRKKSTKNSKKNGKTLGVLRKNRAPWQQKKETLKTKKKR